MAKNELEIIIEQNALEPSKAKYILEQFQRFFGVADEWTAKAKTLVVTNASQTAEMELAREGRLFLREQRISIEKARKDLKEQSLREGKAIDGIANVLKALIVPIEEYLEHQEKFVQIQEEAKLETRRQEIEARMAEEERIAAEKAAAEQERLRVENEQLKKVAQANEIAMQKERKKQEAILAAERKKQTDILNAERARAEEEIREVARKAKIESDKQAKKLAEERARANAELEEAEEKARVLKEKERAKLEAERKEKERLAELLKNQITCPNCGHKFQLKKG
jgi:hypothetical protein